MTENTKVCPKCRKRYYQRTQRLGTYCDECNKDYNSVLKKLRSENSVPTDHKCLICQKSEEQLKDIHGRNGRMQSKWALDHCHGSGEFRGFLCRNCNNGLGRFEDDPELLIKAASYLQHHFGRSWTGYWGYWGGHQHLDYSRFHRKVNI